jgi:hypothetical protein
MKINHVQLFTITVVFAAFLFLQGCAPGFKLVQNYESVKPATVLVLPPENTTAGTEIEEKVYPIIYEKMSRRGYYCISPELARGVFNANKLEDAARINTIPAAKMKEIFGVDAVLRVVVTEWSSKYIVISSSVNVGFKLTLISTTTGEELWSYERILSKSPGGGNSGLIGALVNAAVNAALTQYEPIAEENANNMISTIPMGVFYGKW